MKVLVIGLGSIGLLMLKGLRAFGVNAYGLDVSSERSILAAQHGFCFEDNKKYDVVFLTAGSDSAIKTALKHVIDGGKIIERGTHEQLIAEKGKYYQLYTGAFELE